MLARLAAEHDLGAFATGALDERVHALAVAWEISEPICVSASSGSPIFSWPAFSVNAITKSS